ncbi:hypothetical protein [Chengkuizengella marina]|uniref:C-type cytochrome biogenesis protein CcmI n=1 Tax=Chengkuizengella marina TaxID=2507566 RepID=A0A6N9Q4K3_9BACL|nr:hypothetical protein [Chengkuizengella marina]NBI29544.1 hypothetical protein [Chengkuizengella marina]
MDFIVMLTSALIIIGCLYMVLAPFFHQKILTNADLKKSSDNEVIKQEFYATLNEIEMDYKMNKLSEYDYRQLKKEVELFFVELLRDQDQLPELSKEKENKQILEEIQSEIQIELELLRKERGLKG